MAKFNHGILSKTKGKLGGIVFQQYEGMQIGKEYQPNVKNPNSSGQIDIRARFKAVSQFIALWSRILTLRVASVSPYTRTKRGRLVKDLLPVAIKTGNDVQILLGNAEIQLNSVAHTTDVALAVAGTPANFTVTPTFTTTDSITIITRIVGFDAQGQVIGQNDIVTTSPTSGTAINIPLPLVSGEATRYDIMSIAMVAVTENGNTTYGNLIANSATTNEYTTTLSLLVSAGDVEPSAIASFSFSL